MDEAFLSRIDEHMRRGSELMEQIRAEHELHRKQAAEADARYQEQIELTRQEVQITREVVRRNEIAFQANSRLNAELVGAVVDVRDTVREVRADLRELGAEVRAQTEAIFRMLDRFDGGSEPAGA